MMRPREVDCAYCAVVGIDPSSGGQKVARARATVDVKEADDPAHYDEIEHSDSDDSDGSEKPDEISDDSSNLGDEVPVATKLQTGRIRRRKVRLKRGDGDDVGGGGKLRVKKAAPKDWILKYLQPNVSNVADRSNHGNAGNGSSFIRASTHLARESEASYKDPTSNEEVKEQRPNVDLAGGGQPEGTSMAEYEGMEDADDEDFTEFEDSPSTKWKNRHMSEKDQAQKTPVAATVDCSHSSEEPLPSRSLKAQVDDFEISPRKPLAENYQRDVKSVPERMPRTKEKGLKENKAHKKRKLSFSKDSRRQLSLKSILRPFQCSSSGGSVAGTSNLC